MSTENENKDFNAAIMKNKWITPYSTYHLSRYSNKPKKIVECENKDCKKKFITNIDRKRCSKECAKKARKQNKNISTEKLGISERYSN